MGKNAVRRSSASSSSRPTTGTVRKFVEQEEMFDHHTEKLLERIRQRAYEKWEAAGRPEGDGFDFWLAAELELTKPR